MHYIIDGYNFLFSLNTEITHLESDRTDLIESLKILLKGLKSSIIFDSAFPHAEDYPSRAFQDEIEVIYAPDGQTADNYIIELITYKKNRSELRVITSDNHLARHIQALSCRTESISSFLDYLLRRQRKMSKKGKPPMMATTREIERLMKIFEQRLKEPTHHEWLVDPRKPPL